MKKAKRKQQTARIYYGPAGRETSMYWTVKVTDATRPVTINGTVLAALKAHPGRTIGCAMSITAMDNKRYFGHPAYLVSVTKSTMLVVDKLRKDGSPLHAVRYGHSYSEIVDQNDDGSLKELVKENPALMERAFELRPPRKRPSGPHVDNVAKGTTHHKSIVPLQHRGALARAVRAKLMGKNVAQQLTHALKDEPER